MTETLETRLYKTLKKNPDFDTVKQFIYAGVDCNLSYVDRYSRTFQSPIQLAVKTDRRETLRLLYKHRNSPTRIQLKKHLTFYINHHDRLQEEKNEILFHYTVSRLLYTRITKHSKIVFDTLIAALHDYDHAKYRTRNLSKGSTTEIFLQLRIYTLFQKIIEMKINSNNNESTIIEEELLHNLETYYFLISIKNIPVIITREMINETFSIISMHKPHLKKYYQSIAENVISKIEKLKINQEYTIPTGWIRHAVCVSFQRINETHIVIRIDNLAPDHPSDMHKIVHSTKEFNITQPKILGQLHVDHLEMNLNYFILLIDSVKRDLTFEDGKSLIYNLDGQIINLHQIQMRVPCFVEQARANCFVKCFHPGFWIRVGEKDPKLYKRLLLAEKDNANLFASRCIEEYQHNFNHLFDQFTTLVENEDIQNPPFPNRKRLQDKLKMSYKQHYKHLLNNNNIEHCSLLDDKYIRLRFENNNKPIDFKNLFIKSRVLMIGEAGCGKTTVCQYITYSWAIERKLWSNQFEWIFYIKMRNLNSKIYPSQSNNYLLIDIIEKECFQGHKLDDFEKQTLANQFENSSNILWILDGFDERMIPEYLYSVEQELLTKSYLLLTSRTYATYNFPYDIQIQIQNFTETDMENYISKYFSFTLRTTGRECWTFISCCEQLRQTARIPACLEIICSLWENDKDKLEFGISKGKLYQKMCDYLLRRYLLKFNYLCNSALIGRDIYQEPNALVFEHLEHLAFEATKEHRFTINGHEIKKIVGLQFRSVLQIFLLIPKTQDDSSSLLLENVYYFVHRSFQEYLCARYIIRILKSSCSTEQKKEVIQFITHEKYNRHIRDTFCLFFELENFNLCIDQFWLAVESEPRDLVGLRHCSRIAQWFPKGTCLFSLDDQRKIDQRTTDIILAWISNKDRRAHDYANIYIFEWFADVIDYQYWLTAWKEDLFMENSLKRRYFLPDLWPIENINVLKQKYDSISTDVEGLHQLITRGPTMHNLKRLGLDYNLFRLYTTDDHSETAQFLKKAQEQARRRESITTLAEFNRILQNYKSFANLNRRSEILGKETWPLKISPSVLENMNNETLRLLTTSQENSLFFRYFELPIIPFLKLYANQNDLNDEILCSLIVLITISSNYILTAPPNQKRLIRAHYNETFADIEMDEYRRNRVIHAFDQARHEYGYSSFFPHDFV